jgi:diguanylate cyclase (GGDEF)-like protein
VDVDLAKFRVAATSPSCVTEKNASADIDISVNDLLQKAVQNEHILKRYQRFELKLLDVMAVDELLNLLLTMSLDYFQLDAMELWLYDPQQTLIEYIDDPQLYPHLHFVSDVRLLTQFYPGHPEVMLKSLIDGTGQGVFEGLPIRSAAVLPLVRHGMLVGSLHMGAKGHQRFAIDKSTDFINHLASVVAVCLENVANQERLHRLSMYDMLTQVKNRRAFQQSLDSEVSRASRSGDMLSLLFVDLDYFKSVNDRYGHQTGDRALKTVAQHINQMLRKTDHVCRYGGEEFALILPQCSQRRALDIAERIRAQVSGLDIVNDEGVLFHLTLSVGVSCWQPAGTNNEACVVKNLVACSDKGVYMAKEGGRNATQYVEYTELV